MHRNVHPLFNYDLLERAKLIGLRDPDEFEIRLGSVTIVYSRYQEGWAVFVNVYVCVGEKETVKVLEAVNPDVSVISFWNEAVDKARRDANKAYSERKEKLLALVEDVLVPKQGEAKIDVESFMRD